MTPEDRVIELLERANPVPDPDDVPVPSGGAASLRRHDQRSNTVPLSISEPTTTVPPTPDDPRRPGRLLAVAAAAVLLVTGLVIIGVRSDDQPVPADQPPTPTADPTTDSEPAPTSPPETTVPATTVPVIERTPQLNTGTVLDGGASYQTSTDPVRGMTPKISLSVPEDQGENAWSVLNAFPMEVDFLPLGDWVTGAREPTFGLAPVAEGVTVEDVVASVEAFVADNPGFELAVETGQIRGDTVTVLRGSSPSETGDSVRIPTSPSSGFLVPPRRQFVTYLIEGPSHVVAAKIESSERDLDATIERVVPILDTIEFP